MDKPTSIRSRDCRRISIDRRRVAQPALDVGTVTEI